MCVSKQAMDPAFPAVKRWEASWESKRTFVQLAPVLVDGVAFDFVEGEVKER